MVLKEALESAYANILLSLPENLRIVPPLIIFAVIISFYGIFVWLFYRFLAKRDVIKINLQKYNVFELAWLIKFIAVVFYIIEFIIIIPFVIIFWFSILSMLLLLLIKDPAIQVTTVLMVSAAVISAVRITSYFSEDLSKDLAKMFPFTLLSVALLTPGFFSLSGTFDRFLEIPQLFEVIIFYGLFILIIEVVLRAFFLIFNLFSSDKEVSVQEGGL